MKNTTKNNRGGVRVNAGRKKSTDPKKPITVYIEQSKIEKAGGRDLIKNKLYNSI